MTRRAGWVAAVLAVVATAVVAHGAPRAAAAPHAGAGPGDDAAVTAAGVLAVAVADDAALWRVAGVEGVRPVFGDTVAGRLGRWRWVETAPGEEADVAARLRVDPAVLHVERVRHRTPATADPLVEDQWHLDRIELTPAWRHEDAAGTRLGLIDTGFDVDHPDLDLRDLAGFPGVSSYGQGCDADLARARHGTVVAGAAAATAGNGRGIVGTGGDVTAVAAEVGIPDGGRCLVSGRWPRALADMAEAGVDVVNLSFVGTEPSQLERDAVAHATSRRVVVVAAAGNDDTMTPRYPASYPSVLSVTAVDADGRRWSRANHGPSVELSAPGVDILTTCPGGGYCRASGTSLASAVASGTAALVHAHRHLRSGASAVARLLDGARPGAGRPLLHAGTLFDDPVVRLAGATRYGTVAAIVREVVTSEVDTVVLAPGDTATGWAYALPAVALAKDPGTVVALTPRASLSPATATVLDRLRPDGRVVLVGGHREGISHGLEEELREEFRVERLSGVDAARTAVRVAEAVAEERSPESVLVARADVFADGLALSAVAAREGHPLLLVTHDGVPPAACDWLGDHISVTTLYLAGGTAAIPSAVADELRDCAPLSPLLTPRVVRHDGADRVATALAVAAHHFPERPSGVVALADGWAWPDAVAGGLLARRAGSPVLLTAPDGLSPAVRRRIPRGGTVLLLGGPAALSRDVGEEAVAAATP